MFLSSVEERRLTSEKLEEELSTLADHLNATELADLSAPKLAGYFEALLPKVARSKRVKHFSDLLLALDRALFSLDPQD